MRANYDVVMIVINDIESDSRVLRTAQSVSDSGLGVLLLGLGKQAAGLDSLKQRGFHAYRVPAAAPEKVAGGDPKSRRRAVMDEFQAAVLDVCRNFSPRVVHSHDMSTIATGAALKSYYGAVGRPAIWIHDIHEWVEGLTQIAAPLRDLSLEHEQTYLPEADILTTVSPAIAEIVTEAYGLAEAPSVIFNAPPLREFDPEFRPDVRTSLGLGPDTPLAVYAGQVKEPRAVHELVAALEYLPDLHAALVTNNKGKYVDRLRSIADQTGSRDRLRIIPYVDQRHVSSFIRTADVGVLTLASYGNADVALPNKLFQYIHAGLPVVVSDRDAMVRFVQAHPVGLIYQAGEVKALANAISRVLRSNHDYRAAAWAARTEYSWEQQEETLRRIYAQALGAGAITTAHPVQWPSFEDDAEKAENPIRVLHGVAGSANQPWTLAAAMRRRGHFAHNLVAALPRLGYRSSVLTPLSRMSLPQTFRLIEGLASDFDVFHLHARSFLFDPPSFHFPSLVDLLLLRLLGKTVVFHFRGTEARLATEFAAANPFNYAASDPYGFARAYPEEVQRRMIEYIRATANAVFVTDPELQGYVPGAEIVPRAIDLRDWHAVGPRNEHRPVVVHAPTRPEIKGTDHIARAVETLRAEGIDFEYIEVKNVQHELAREIYERADVIVDQLLIGWYGVLAVEGMALAKPVVSYIRPDLLHHLGTPLPLAVADPSNVTEILRSLLADASRRQELGMRGRAHVERIHDADAIAAFLERRYRELSASAPTRGADYAGIAEFFLLQAEVSRAAHRSAAGAVNTLGRTEQLLSSSVPDAERALRRLRDVDDSRAAADSAEAVLRALISATKLVSSATAALDPTRRARGIRHRPVAPTQPAIASASAEPALSPARPDPDIHKTADQDRWGAGRAIRRLMDDGNGTWEEIAAAIARRPDVGLELFDRIVAAEQDDERDAVAARLAIGAARTFERRGNNLIIAAPENGEPGAPDPTLQVRFARSYYNLRHVLGHDAELVAAALLRAVLPATDEDANPLRHAPDDAARTRLNDLCWFFINTSAVSRTLGSEGVAAYQRSLDWFIERLPLWEVASFRTTRASLSAGVPIRISLDGERDEGKLPPLSVQSRTPGAHLHLVKIYNRSSGRLDWIEGTLNTRIDQAPDVDLELLLPAPRRTAATISLPELEFDPVKTAPITRRWNAVDTVAIDDRASTYRLKAPLEHLIQSSGLTTFDASGDGFVSRTLKRQIEQMETLAELHGRTEFSKRARIWETFAEHWAGAPVGSRDAGPVA